MSYVPVSSSEWSDTDRLVSFLVSKQKSEPVDGFFLACKNEYLSEISRQFRKTFPKVPFVDVFAPVLMAANIVSGRYMVLTGSKINEGLIKNLIKKLGIGNHLRFGGSSIFRDSFLVTSRPFNLTTKKDTSVGEIVTLGEASTGAHSTDILPVINIEAIALAGCEGFLYLGVASESQTQLTNAKIPLQVINPVKASMGLLYSMIRNKIWVSGFE